MRGTADVPPDTVLFDLGRVLVRWDPYLPFEGWATRAEVDTFFREVDFPAFNHLQDAGRPLAEARAALAASHPAYVAFFDRYVERFADSVPGEVPGAHGTVRTLVDAGVRVLGLTNWSAENVHVAWERGAVVGLLEDVLVSGREGLGKPDPRIFRLAVERFGLDPARTLFVDDSPANVDGARAVGLRAEVFTDHDALRALLAGLGLWPDDGPAAGRT